MCIKKLKITEGMTDRQIRNRVELYVITGYFVYVAFIISIIMLFK